MRRIRKFGEEILRKKSSPVDNIDGKIHELIKSMKETLLYVKGVGLSAPQVGVLKRIFIFYDKEKEILGTIINPEIVEEISSYVDLEGCLSFPEIYFTIERPKITVIKGLNEDGKEIIIEGKELLSRCFQHEIDHLNGILIIDYAGEEEKRYYQDKIDKLIKNSKK
ncbi:MAG: peptide deformylase [Candidatus Omnitrophica bacterium]|nr:peptide deformylase [Candidatus Omnitrophota bacterium]MCM8806418.1 peptide deformylase [Candidatus Omnitrophota bacterium]